MCSIIGSFHKDDFLKLVKQNESRGSFSHSLTSIKPDRSSMSTRKNWGAFDISLLDDVVDGDYMLGHCQAPTGGLIKDINRIHPYKTLSGVDQILHNGILTPETMLMINQKLKNSYEWDTQALLEYLKAGNDWNVLNDITGSFACVYLKGLRQMYAFRNQIAPLYYRVDLTISSTPFVGANQLPYNTIVEFNLLDRRATPVESFNNQYCPYFLD